MINSKIQTKDKTMKLNKPSQDEMKRVFALWEEQHSIVHYNLESKALELLFKQYPLNTNLSEVILKVACLNMLYGANARMHATIPQIAEKIISIKDFDKRVQKWDESLVIELAKFPNAKLYSFASKYCVLHNHSVYNKDDYVILDSIVPTKLRQFKKAYPKYKFAQFKDKDFKLENYGKYKQILENFRADFALGCSLRELDWYLWKLGKLEKLEK